MDLPIKPPKTPPAKRPPKKSGSPQDERQSAALDKIAKNYRRVRVAERRKGPQFIMVLLALLVVALALYKIFGTGFFKNGGPAITDVAPENAPDDAAGPLDPLPFREAIESFERPLLGESPSPDLATLKDTVLNAGAKLASDLHLAAPAAAQRAATGLEAALAQLSAKDPAYVEDFSQLRREWLSLRRREMLAADFFLNAAEPAAADQIALTAYRSQASALDQAIAGAFDRAAAYAREPEPGETEGERAARQAGLEEVAADLRRQLEELAQSQPERPSGNVAPPLMVAVQNLEQALSQARSLAGSTSNILPEGRAGFDNVQQLIASAQDSLDELER